MSAPQSLVQAALQRLGARLGSGLVDAAANLALLAQDAPERLRQEFQLFWDEVEAEAARIERDDEPEVAITAPSADIQDQIDALRARVAAMARRLDQDS
ncbi:hypothetical protein KBY99_04705 [Cyanobium sp. Maggiore-St4-Cus]|uniref:hypothetical protein n=1 Tax=Cyanobium sp. Maggiore-St4-Cus TaxID=2823717 RepID=UPI0020CC6D06|nr:hypothetical protein [Cyanobium sp. Maggiore-St4-Cus]MCP9788280.1 hypothetical protein [Cyanobium sp. Maggiore-St4-Cus]MCP9879391.1 hypothetical protein [Cyanobium sp. A1C-AMD]